MANAAADRLRSGPGDELRRWRAALCLHPRTARAERRLLENRRSLADPLGPDQLQLGRLLPLLPEALGLGPGGTYRRILDVAEAADLLRDGGDLGGEGQAVLGEPGGQAVEVGLEIP